MLKLNKMLHKLQRLGQLLNKIYTQYKKKSTQLNVQCVFKLSVDFQSKDRLHPASNHFR